MADVAIDNDVVFKSVCYGFFDQLLAAIPHGPHTPGILGTARFVLPKLLKKHPPQRLDQAKVELEQVLQTLETLEPSEAESALAAALEYEAQRQALPIHAGECQLIAMLLTRRLGWLLTGDRAAIEGMATLALPANVDAYRLHGRFISFEQGVQLLMDAVGASTVRAAVCAECEVDTALRLCFSCASPEVEEASWWEGLDSHIQNLRDTAGPLLMS